LSQVDVTLLNPLVDKGKLFVHALDIGQFLGTVSLLVFHYGISSAKESPVPRQRVDHLPDDGRSFNDSLQASIVKISFGFLYHRIGDFRQGPIMSGTKPSWIFLPANLRIRQPFILGMEIVDNL